MSKHCHARRSDPTAKSDAPSKIRTSINYRRSSTDDASRSWKNRRPTMERRRRYWQIAQLCRACSRTIGNPFEGMDTERLIEDIYRWREEGSRHNFEGTEEPVRLGCAD